MQSVSLLNFRSADGAVRNCYTTYGATTLSLISTDRYDDMHNDHALMFFKNILNNVREVNCRYQKNLIGIKFQGM